MHRFADLVALTALLMLAGCGARPPAAAPPPLRSVVTTTVTDAALAERIRIVGVLVPKDELRLSFKVGGVIDAIAVEEGSTVHRGQLLASLSATEVDSQVRQAREAATKAQRDYARGKALYDDGVATREQLDDLGTVTATTQAGLSAALFNARYARIEAPADGVVLKKFAQAHELVQPGQPVLSVSSLDRGWIVRGAFSDRDVVRVHPGDHGEVRLDAFADRQFTGTVSNVGSSADPQTGTYAVEFRVDPAGAAFAEGMVAKVEVLRPAATGAARPVVPLTALIEADGDNAYVFVVDPGSAVVHRRNVRLGPNDRERISIIDGLRAGEQVVVEGGAFVNDGERVQITAAATH